MICDCFMSASNDIKLFSTFISIMASVWSNAERDRAEVVLSMPC